jgi:hypothetical protein
MCVLTVLTQMCISLATSAVLSMSDRCRSRLPLAFGERLGRHNRGLFRGALPGRALIMAQGRCEQAPVGMSQFGVTPPCRRGGG